MNPNTIIDSKTPQRRRRAKVLSLLEERPQLNILLHPFFLLKTIFWCLRQMLLSVSVHDAHVVNTVGPILPEVTYQEVTLLFCGL